VSLCVNQRRRKVCVAHQWTCSCRTTCDATVVSSRTHCVMSVLCNRAPSHPDHRLLLTPPTSPLCRDGKDGRQRWKKNRRKLRKSFRAGPTDAFSANCSCAYIQYTADTSLTPLNMTNRCGVYCVIFSVHMSDLAVSLKLPYTVSKNGHTFYFCDYSVCCWPILKICGSLVAKEIGNKTHFKLYIDAWYLIVTQAENTSSMTTVDINMTQQNPTLKIVTQFEMNAKHSKRRSYQVFLKNVIQLSLSFCPLAFTQARNCSRHCSIAWSTTCRWMPDHTAVIASSRQCPWM